MKKSELDKIKSAFWYDPIKGHIGKHGSQEDLIRFYKTHSGKTYGRVGLGDKRYKAHRVAIFLMTGYWPDNQVDHADGDGTNNKYSNLKVVTPEENNRNMRRFSTNKSGLSGVFWDKNRNKWNVQMQVGRKRKYLGSFDCLLDAAAARIKANNRYGFSEAHVRERPL